ncbi:MAG TPA: hypothetical protein PLC48_06100 [Ferruginibacter sp.]|nr:hypothetical protein [Ferruginibacter sp.]
MRLLANKQILIISPQNWGTLFVSKQHYAIELAKRGNTVYFLCPSSKPLQDDKESVVIKPSGTHERLFIIYHKPFFSLKLKFHAMPVFHWLMRIHTRAILKKINKEIDIIWSFDLGNYFPFRFFDKNAYRIFHPVDEPLNQEAIQSARGADILFSVTNEILEKYHHYQLPSYFINHGVTDEFLAIKPLASRKDQHIHVGFSGNLRREDIDRKVLLEIIEENPGVIFDCWGMYENVKQGINEEETDQFINRLKSFSNIRLHGMVTPGKLAVSIQEADAFLICYDVEKDQSKGTNYHKVLEFISTGKVIISNNISAYQDKPEMVMMVKERKHNTGLPALFKTVIGQLEIYNSEKLQADRRIFAADNAYSKQVDRIELILSKQMPAVQKAVQ